MCVLVSKVKYCVNKGVKVRFEKCKKEEHNCFLSIMSCFDTTQPFNKNIILKVGACRLFRPGRGGGGYILKLCPPPKLDQGTYSDQRRITGDGRGGVNHLSHFRAIEKKKENEHKKNEGKGVN